MAFHIAVGSSFDFQDYSITRVSARKLEAHLGGRWIGSVATLKRYDELLRICCADRDELQAASDLLNGQPQFADPSSLPV
ncbi:hypothetical protein J2847_005866 [Azospirillum agricola]|uniref:hypothetical protein n=1 Tax=Azospirillum agricola TaxID=1720247 RepID=UPI001AE5E8EA|nr:hypothetical protein [Azospirillum agricola]MBP2232537.1 hypothetical protein [Azospirillum agricola]